MSGYVGDFPVNFTALVLVFDSFAAATGAPSATTNFASSDLLIYKDGGTTQRSSAAGIVVSTSFDGQTGLQLVTIDLSDNTDAGFYAAGHEYQVAVADITVDAQTLRFWLGTFSIERAGGVLALLKATGTVKVDVVKWNGTTVSTPTVAGVPNVNVKTWNDLTTVALPLVPTTAGRTLDVSVGGEAGVDWANVGSPTTTVGLTGTTISSAQVVASVTGAVGSVTGAVGSVTGNVGGNVVGSVGSVTGAVGSVTGAVGSVTGNVGGNVVGSVGSVTGAVGSVTGNVGGTVASVVGNVGGNVVGSVGSVVGAVGSVTGSVASVTGNVGGNVLGSVASLTVNNDKTGYALSNAGIDAVLDRADGVEVGWSLRQTLRVMAASIAGKLSGAATATVLIRNILDTKTRITATVDGDGNRSAVTLDGT